MKDFRDKALHEKNGFKWFALGASVFFLVILLALPVSAAGLNRETVTINVKKTCRLKVTGVKGKVKWKSSDKTVVSVSNKGKVTARKRGQAVIVAKVGKKKYTCRVTVKQPVTSVKLNKKTASLKQTGYTLKLKATVTPDNANNKELTWTSSDKKVAVVNKNGRVTAVGRGKCVITAKTTDGSKKTAKCTVKVTSDSSLIMVSSDDEDADHKECDLQLLPDSLDEASGCDAYVLDKTCGLFVLCSWSAADPEIVDLTEDSIYYYMEKITPKKTGETTITATLRSDKFAQKQISRTVSVNYSEKQQYVNTFVDNWLSENLTESLTDYDKMEKIAYYVGSFPHSTCYDWPSSLMEDLGMNYLATCQMTAYLCTAAGLPAMPCDAGTYYGETLVKADGTFYLVYTGYEGTGEGRYSIEEATTEEIQSRLSYFGHTESEFAAGNLSISNPTSKAVWNPSVRLDPAEWKLFLSLE